MKKSFVLASIIALLSAPLSAAVVYLKDGTQLNGTIVSATARDVQLQTAEGLRKIESDDIRRIDYAEDVAPPRSVSQRRVERREEREAWAEPGEERQMMSIGFGFANPLSRISLAGAGGGSGDNGDAGFMLGTQYNYFINRRLGLGFDLSYLNRSRTGSQSLLPAANTDIYGDTLLLLATARLSLVDHGRARPFILGGIGTNRTSTLIDATPNQGFSWSDTSTGETRTLVDESRWGPAVTARFGVDFYLVDPVVFTFELGWTGLSNSDYGATSAGKDLGLEKVKGDLDILTVAARWGWRF